MVERPEEYQGSSLYYREMGDDRWMIPLTRLTGRDKRKDALIDLLPRQCSFQGQATSCACERAVITSAAATPSPNKAGLS
ncbi:MAG: hypothetical protein MUC50_18155 [Myxococcota bacterium]|jgi:hypothetical protein|nr:hypothetical protein [Myxococcota bacterium]